MAAPEVQQATLERAKLAVRITALRETEGYSVPEVARRAGIHYRSLRNIEAGRQNPSWQTLRRILEALDVPLTMVDWTDAEFEAHLAERRHRKYAADIARLLAGRDAAGMKDLRSRDAGQPGAQNVYLAHHAHHDQWALAQVS